MMNSVKKQRGAALILCLLALWAACQLPVSAFAAPPAIITTEITEQPDRIFLIFHASGNLKHKKMFMLQNPDRLVIDLETVAGQGVQLPRAYRGGLIRGLRFGQFDPQTSRIVVDLARPVREASIHRFEQMRSKAPRLVVEIEGIGVRGISKRDVFSVPTPVFKPVADIPKSEKPLIVLDPGHGGKDPGASGKRGTIEKEVTLEVARYLRKELLRTGRYRVAMTRESDTLISLRDRVAMGRRVKADLFISVHADSAPGPNAHGLSVYTLSETASDEEAAALAREENQSDEIAGVSLSDTDAEVAGILIDLARRETKNKSGRLADIAVGEFRRQGVLLLKNTHRFAGFRVLKAPDIPSMLVEIGFLTNPGDEARLNTEHYRRQLARGLTATLDRYFDGQ